MNSDDKTTRILHAARERFIRFGYKRTSVDDIARGAGVSKGGVYLYYTSKKELFRAALDSIRTDLIARAHQHLPNSSTQSSSLETDTLTVFSIKTQFLNEVLQQNDPISELTQACWEHAPDIMQRFETDWISIWTLVVQRSIQRNDPLPHNTDPLEIAHTLRLLAKGARAAHHNTDTQHSSLRRALHVLRTGWTPTS